VHDDGDDDVIIVVEHDVSAEDFASVVDEVALLMDQDLLIYVKYSFPCIDSVELEHDIIEFLSDLTISRFTFSKVDWSADSWRLFFSCVEDHPIIRSIVFGKMCPPIDILVDVLPGLTLGAIEFSYCHFNQWDFMSLMGCLPTYLRELEFRWCNLPRKALESGVRYLREVTRREIETISFICEFGLEGVDFVDAWLDCCPNVREVILHENYVVPEIVDRLCSPSAYLHPSMRVFSFSGWGYQESMLLPLHQWLGDIRRMDARRVMAFMHRRVRRIASKSSIRKLFPDVDRLVWMFLA